MTTAQEISEYDPLTCVKAGELRAAGLDILEDIPDCAWVPRSSIKTEIKVTPLKESDRTMDAELAYIFTVPFKWVQVEGTVTI